MSKILFEQAWSFTAEQENHVGESLKILKEIRNAHPEFDEEGVYLNYSLKRWDSGNALLTIQFVDRNPLEPKLWQQILEIAILSAIGFLIVWFITS